MVLAVVQAVVLPGPAFGSQVLLAGLLLVVCVTARRQQNVRFEKKMSRRHEPKA